MSVARRGSRDRVSLLPSGRSGVIPWIVLVHLAVLAVFWFPSRKVPLGDEVVYLAAARRWLAGGEMSLELLWPPLYPWLVALGLTVGGGSVLGLQLLQAALLAVTAWALRGVALRIFSSAVAADSAAVLVLCYPPLVAFSHHAWPEVFHLALFSLLLRVLVVRRPGWRHACASGGLLGAALLTKSLLTPFAPFLFLPWVAIHRRRGALLAASALAIAAMVVLPSVYSNYKEEGVAVVASSRRFNAWESLLLTSRRTFIDPVAGQELTTYRESADSYAGREEILRQKIDAELERRGLWSVLWQRLGRDYFRLLDTQSYFTAQLPGGPAYAMGVGYRDCPAWFAALLWLWSSAAYVGLWLVSIFGGLILCTDACRNAAQRAGWLRAASVRESLGRAGPVGPPDTAPGGRLARTLRDGGDAGQHSGPQQPPLAWVVMFLGFVLYVLLLCLLVSPKSRYRVQLLPVVFLAAAFSLAWLRSSGGWRRLPQWQVRLASVLVAVFLFLAFGGPLLDSLGL